MVGVRREESDWTSSGEIHSSFGFVSKSVSLNLVFGPEGDMYSFDLSAFLVLLSDSRCSKKTTNPWRFRPFHQLFHEMETYQLIIFPEVVSFLALSITFNIPAVHQLPQHHFARYSNIYEKMERRDVRIVSLNFSGASFIPLSTAPSLPISLPVSPPSSWDKFHPLREEGDVRRYPTRI